MLARIELGGRDLGIDLSRPVSVAVPLDFRGAQPRHFGAPRASSRPFEAPGFAGSVERGASCNCESVTLIPHCNGTHTECVGHLTREPLDAHRVIPPGLLPALLVSVAAEGAPVAGEDSEPLPLAGDRLITRRALERAWSAAVPFEPQALLVRTLPNTRDKLTHDYSGETPPYLTRQAAELLVRRGIRHLVVDVPSIDRAHDEGRLTAHRVFFGLPPRSVALGAAARPDATVTELAFMPDELADGAYFLELQAPALGGDAVASRPLLYRLTERPS
ncbi:MAG TPA: cyclase family protein [Steroidobacteraceae bacterium]|nr:cyclase family protein [Steroidobacteraceae bacterium]